MTSGFQRRIIKLLNNNINKYPNVYEYTPQMYNRIRKLSEIMSYYVQFTFIVTTPVAVGRVLRNVVIVVKKSCSVRIKIDFL